MQKDINKTGAMVTIHYQWKYGGNKYGW